MEAFIIDAVRTAGGRRKGRLSGVHPADLGAHVLDALMARVDVDPAKIDDVILGCVTQGGEQTFQIARNSVLSSNLPDSVPAVTIDRQCGSSQQAIQFAAQAVISGTQDIVIAGGVESMSRVPIFSAMKIYGDVGMPNCPISPRIQKRYGVEMFSQFAGAQMIADKYGFDREALDSYALESHRRASRAIKSGAFDAEVAPIEIDGALHKEDEGVRHDASYEAIASLDPLEPGGVITAGNASQICDGAAAVLIVNERALQEHGLTPLARIIDVTVTAGDPVIMLEEPINSTRRALQRAGLTIDEIDLFEVNEAFSPIPMAWLKEVEADPEKMNVHGGAISLGHPLGATGAKLMTTLVHALCNCGQRYGLQTMCEGGGIANTTIIEACR